MATPSSAYFDRPLSPTLTNTSTATATAHPHPHPHTNHSQQPSASNYRTSDVGTFRTVLSNASNTSRFRPKITTVPPFARHDSIAMPDDDDIDHDDDDDDHVTDTGRKSGVASSAISAGRPSAEMSLMQKTDHNRDPSSDARTSQSTASPRLRALTKPPAVANPRQTLRQTGPRPSANTPGRLRTGGGDGRGDDSGAASDGDSKWWTFTIPVKYRNRVETYLYGQDGDARDDGTGRSAEKEKQRLGEGVELDEKSGGMGAGPGDGQEMRQRKPLHLNGRIGRMDAMLPNFEPMSINQAQTPGWSAPWTPFKRTRTDPLDLEALHPGPPSSASRNATPAIILKIRDFLLHNPFAPLVLRVFNAGFTATTLALAIRIRLVEKKNDLEGVIGSSTTYAIIVAPVTLVHVLSNVYLEYFGRPIGIWSVRTKMIHTLVELLFICLWSAELSLAFDDEFTTPIECTSWTPNGRFRNPGFLDDATVKSSTANLLCNYQASLVSLTAFSVLLYTSVLITSLFRIFNKVGGRADRGRP